MYTNCLADSCRKSISTAPEFDLSIQFVCHLLDGNWKWSGASCQVLFWGSGKSRRRIQEVFIMPLWFLLESSHSCGILWNPVELFLAESPAKIAIPGTIYSSGIEPFWNWHRNGPGMDWNGIWRNAVLFFFFCMYDKVSIILTPLGDVHTSSGMFLSHTGCKKWDDNGFHESTDPRKFTWLYCNFSIFWISNLCTLVNFINLHKTVYFFI